MTDAELLRAMAQWYRDGHTFSPLFGDDRCGCFSHARCAVAEDRFRAIPDALYEVIGVNTVGVAVLVEAGWTGYSCTDDAIAACEIAADLAS